MAKRLLIGMDVDGVVADFIKSFREICMEVTGRWMPVVSTAWNFTNWGLDALETRAAWEKLRATENFWAQLSPCADATTGLLRDLEEKHILYFITTRPATKGLSVEMQTCAFMECSFGLRFPQVIVSSDKGTVAKALGLDYFIDDKPENLRDIMKATTRTKLFLRDQLYNQNVPQHVLPASTYERVMSLGDFAARLH